MIADKDIKIKEHIMIKIIRHGDPEEANKFIRFDCNNCGCVWKTNSDYTWELTEWLQEIYTARCPNCHETTWVVIECFSERDV